MEQLYICLTILLALPINIFYPLFYHMYLLSTLSPSASLYYVSSSDTVVLKAVIYSQICWYFLRVMFKCHTYSGFTWCESNATQATPAGDAQFGYDLHGNLTISDVESCKHALWAVLNNWLRSIFCRLSEQELQGVGKKWWRRGMSMCKDRVTRREGCIFDVHSPTSLSRRQYVHLRGPVLWVDGSVRETAAGAWRRPSISSLPKSLSTSVYIKLSLILTPKSVQTHLFFSLSQIHMWRHLTLSPPNACFLFPFNYFVWLLSPLSGI